MSSKHKTKESSLERLAFDKETKEFLEKKSEKYKVKPITDGHADLLEAIEDCQYVICSGPAGSGKALAMDAKIYTPDGYKLNKDISIGDKVLTPNGKANVIGVYPQPITELFKLTFNDGSSVECCDEHLWEVTHIQNGWTKVVNTRYIRSNYLNSKGRKVLKIRTCEPANFNSKNYYIHPYLLGLLISEGCLVANPRFTTNDEEVLNKAKSVLNNDYEIDKTTKTSKYNYVIKNRIPKPINLINQELKRLGLHGLHSYEKFIPEEYLFGSIEQRLELLHGIMDGDGTVNRTSGSPVLYTTSEKLKDSFIQLINSLGGTVSVTSRIPTYTYNNEKLQGKLCWVLTICVPEHINCFNLKRKASLQKKRMKYKPVRYVENVESVGKKESQCIMIDDKEHLYLTNNFIVTHNTHLALGKGMEYLKNDKFKKLLLIRPLQECGRQLGFFPGKKEEKLIPHMKAFQELFHKFCSAEQLERFIREEKVVIDTCEFMRGCTFDDTYIVIDEAQNCDYKQLKMLLTRLGKNSKMVIVGDATQCDLPSWMLYYNNEDDAKHKIDGKVPMAVMMDRLEDRDDDIEILELTEEDIVRNGLLGKILRWMDGK